MSNWNDILARLLKENLKGPTSAPSTSSHSSRTSAGNSYPSANSFSSDDDWVRTQDIDTSLKDMDARDPRWLVLFMEYFLEMDSTNDDLLFFVRDPDVLADETTNNASLSACAPQDPIFVKRKVNKQMPQLSHIVDWKQTFFLNLIIQLPCTLTVAVCRRLPSVRVKRDIEEEGVEMVARGGTGVSGNNKPAQSKSRMVALRRITKRVYAAPYKSRMDVKDAFMHEVSFPYIYYTVNDYESQDLHLPINPHEYLCVELSVVTPLKHRTTPTTTTPTTEDITVPIETDSTPFPVPHGYEKVVLFQGAVPYASLLDVFQQKAAAAAAAAATSGLRRSWGQIAQQQPQSQQYTYRGSTGSITGGDQRVEYIMMRGPHGKGQCQVAIRDNSMVDDNQDVINKNDDDDENDENDDDHSRERDGEERNRSIISNTNSNSGSYSFSDRFKIFTNTVRAGLNAVAGVVASDTDTGLGSGGNVGQNDAATAAKRVESLRCSMTYVNVPWGSIISDLFDRARQKPTAK